MPLFNIKFTPTEGDDDGRAVILCAIFAENADEAVNGFINNMHTDAYNDKLSAEEARF